jgi:hypothetical protein
MVACGCETGSGLKAHNDKYAGFGANFCNVCRCHAGQEICTEHECHVHSSSQICASTTCNYGVRFAGTDELLSTTQSIEEYGANWEDQPHEMTTLVKHHSADANGAKFSCGHVRHTEECRCYCTAAAGATTHIWHHAQRHADSIAKGLTAAGCTCQANWTHDGQTYNGCQNPSSTPNPLLDHGDHGDKHDAWCKIVAGSCVTGRAAPAGADWDTCSEHRTFDMHIDMSKI